MKEFSVWDKMPSHQKHKRVHRLSWEEAFGPIPENMEVCHHCDNPACYEITHLYLGTHRDNMRDMVAKGRGNHIRGAAHPQSKLNEAQVAEIRATVVVNRIGVNGSGVTLAAQRFGVDKCTIRRVLRGLTWVNVK